VSGGRVGYGITSFPDTGRWFSHRIASDKRIEVANEKAGLCSKRAQYTENGLNLRLTWTRDLLEPIGKVRRVQP